MDSEINGNRQNRIVQDEGGSTIRSEELSYDASGAPSRVNEVASPSWATRMDDLKIGATNRKPLVLLGAGVSLAVVLFVVTSLFSKTPATREKSVSQKSAQGNSPAKLKEGVTPVMDAVKNTSTSNSAEQVTPADIHRTKVSSPAPNAAAQALAPASRATPPETTLASIPSFDSTQQHWEEPKPYGGHQTDSTPSGAPAQTNLLKEASLVFVRKSEAMGAVNSLRVDQANPNAPELSVTPGTRIQARLETQASSAVTAPVVAVVEYTYALGEHLVIPSGARVYGQLQQADKSGAVSIKFNEIELLDGVRSKIEAIGTSLELGPIKGTVSGKNTGRNFLVRTASGIGSIAAMVMGNNTSSTFSEDDLIRQRIAENVGNAGDTEIMNMTLTNRIVVSVPAGTPIYIVFTKRGEAGGSQTKGSSN